MVIGIDASRAFVSERTGTENYSYELITRMVRLPSEKKHSFVLFTRPNAIIPPELTRVDNVVIKTINLPFLWTQVGLAMETWNRQVSQYSSTPVFQRKITGKLEHRITESRQYIDVLWIPAHTLPLLRNPRVKTVVTIHGLEYRWLPEYHNLLQRWYLPLSTFYAAKAADRVVCVSESTKRDLIKEVDFDIEKASVIYEGASFNGEKQQSNKVKEQQIYNKYGIEDKKYVLFVGTVQPRKNLSALIAAFAKFASSKQDYKLVIAGSIGWRAAADLALPESLGIPDKVVFTGRVDQVVLSALYQGAMIYVQPSWTEGFGLPVLEAMAVGIPTIVSDGGALPEVVGEAGVIVKLNSSMTSLSAQAGSQMGSEFANRLATEIGRVASDKILQMHLITTGKKRVGQLSWDRAARETIQFITRGLSLNE